ncbi:MAG TPA: hypothetical protein VK553_03045 [Candidatus Nitrosopolaris rasttigaisensis]|nr:hypothetical protein [Candidatus Nitrosopolaris rasttigaisensis]
MRQVSTKYDTSLFLRCQDNFPLMRKKLTRWLYVTFAIASIILVSLLFLNNNQVQNLLAQNNNSRTSSSNTTIVKAATTTKNPYNMNSTIGKGVVTMKTTPALTSSNPANILESFMSPKALLASTIDQIRNSTSRHDHSNNETSAARNATILVKNPGILLLFHQIIPPKDFIPVYDAMPYKIMNGQVYAKLPCDSNSKPSLQILAGQLSELKVAQLKLITAVSKPGYMCMYYANLTSTNNDTVVSTNAISNVPNVDNIVTSGGVGGGLRKGNLTITYVELFNPTDYRVVLPSTASLSISVNQVMPLELHHTNGTTGLNQTTPTINQTTPTINQTTIKNAPNQLTRTGISPATAFVYNAWNPYLKQKTYLPIAPLVNETILSNSKCAIHAIWQSPKEEQSDLAELKEYLIVTNNNGDNAPMHLYMCGGAPIP